LVLAPEPFPGFGGAVEKGRVLAIDPGTVRAGLALSDEDRVLATPRATVDATDRLRLVATIVELCREEGVRRIVMGLPRHMTGELAAKAPAVLDLAKRVADATGLEVELVDERLTTVEAGRKLAADLGKTRGRSNKRKSSTGIDAAAAAVLLQSWLDRPR
jgi:putative holliday junction resolvase